MNKLTRSDLYSLEDYNEKRADMRSEVIAHKRLRTISLGDNLKLYFEDRLTMHYQVQEMLRSERIFEAEGIQEELEAYNPLIPDGNNLKATMMIMYGDVDHRRERLAELIGIEECVWIQLGESEKIKPIANEDLERSTDEKTSAVHFLRFEFDDEHIAAGKSTGQVTMGVDHAQYQVSHTLGEDEAKAILADFS